MKFKSLYLLFVAAMAGCTADFNEAVKIEQEQIAEAFEHKDIIKNELVVKFSRETTDELSISRTRSGELTTGNVTLDKLCSEYEIVSMEPIFSMDKFAARKREMGLDQWYSVSVSGKHSASDVALKLNELDDVISVAPQVKIKRLGSSDIQYLTAEQVEAMSATRSERHYFNDPLLPEQWMLKNYGSKSEFYGRHGFIEGADINVEGAWYLCGGTNNTLVAVVDGGIDYTHPDLAENIWSGIGYNYVEDSNEVSAEQHGTHVAGTIAAVNDNGIGISGIAGGLGYGDGVKLISCQIFTEEDTAGDEATARAFEYATDNGAVICQNSWGYPISYIYNDATFLARAGVVKDAIDYFIRYAGYDENGKQVGPMAGGLVTFASGNDGKHQTEYPGAYSACVCVASMSGDYRAAWYSTYSSLVDLCAPGGDGVKELPHQAWVLSTLPTSIRNGDTYKSGGRDVIVDYVRTPGYGYMRGTSMACPHVSGVAALIVSYCGGEGFTNTRLKEILYNSARNVDSYQDASHKNRVGRLVDATAALEMGGLGSNYIPTNYPSIRPKSSERIYYVLPHETLNIIFELRNCDDITVSDSKIKVNHVEDMLTLVVDASLYEDGLYTVTITGKNDVGENSIDVQFSVDAVDVVMYPNPCEEDLNLQLEPIKGEYRNCDVQIKITNSIGVAVFEQDAQFSGRYPLKLDVAKLNPGRYTVKAVVEYDNYAHTVTRTIIKR